MTTQTVGTRRPASLPASLIGGIFGGFVAALLAIPTAEVLQMLVKEVWQATAPDQARESLASTAERAGETGDPVAQHRPRRGTRNRTLAEARRGR